jgi:RNA polymerase sigma factor (sigma-70 family)
MESDNSNNQYAKNIEHAFQIFSEHDDFINSVIYNKVQNLEKTRDLSQNFFLSLVYSPIPPDVQNIRSFIYRAIINDIIDSRSQIERNLKNFQKYSKKMKNAINKTPSSNAYIEKEQIFEMLEMLKEQLPYSCFRAIILRYKENQSVREIAGKMGVKKASVRRYLSIGLKKLRQILTLE